MHFLVCLDVRSTLQRRYERYHQTLWLFNAILTIFDGGNVLQRNITIAYIPLVNIPLYLILSKLQKPSRPFLPKSWLDGRMIRAPTCFSRYPLFKSLFVILKVKNEEKPTKSSWGIVTFLFCILKNPLRHIQWLAIDWYNKQFSKSFTISPITSESSFLNLYCL